LPHPEWWLQPVLDAITLPQIDRKQRGRELNFRATEPALRKKLLRYLRGDRNLTLSAYRELCTDYPEFAESARPVDNLWFVTVQTTQMAGEGLTLDLEVEDNHTYLANGLVTHNSRRGANMAVLRCDHPDIEEFITCKAEEGKVTNFNISVAITDEFMQRCKEDGDFELRNPRDGKVWKTVRARELFAKIVKYAHHNGEPGALFIDAANRSNPVPHLYDLEATNPCVTGNTLIYTSNGLQRAKDLFDTQERPSVVLDTRFGEAYKVSDSSPVFYTGDKLVYRLKTREGYELEATSDHRIMTSNGWIELSSLTPGDKVHILNRKGGFGKQGNLALGRTVGWLFGDGTLNMAEGAALMFFGEERLLAPLFADYVNDIVGVDRHQNQFAPTRTYEVGVQHLAQRNESRLVSTRLKERMAEFGFVNKEQIPEPVLTGSEEMQRGFLLGFFSADGQY